MGIQKRKGCPSTSSSRPLSFGSSLLPRLHPISYHLIPDSAVHCAQPNHYVMCTCSIPVKIIHIILQYIIVLYYVFLL
jgi:hypothetical protein